MKIDDYHRKFEEGKRNGKEISSDPHLISYFRMRMNVYLNGHKNGSGTHMSVYLQLMKGEYDDYIDWPFAKRATLVLVHQDSEKKSYKELIDGAVLRRSDTLHHFRKPVTNFNQGIGFPTFITLSRLHADGFIKNDTIYIRCIIG